MEDTLAKVGLEAVLSPFVRVERQYEVRLSSQFADLLVASQASDPDALWKSLGWLGRMVCSICLLEVFSGTLDERDALACVRKQLAVHHDLELRANRENPTRSRRRLPVPPLWMLVPTHPSALIEAWGMHPKAGWPAGVYEGGLGLLRVYIVVPGELPIAPECIPLQLLGDSFTRWATLRRLKTLQAGHPIVRGVQPLLFWWNVYLKSQPEDETTRNFKMELAQLVEQERRRMLEEIHQEVTRRFEAQQRRVEEEQRRVEEEQRRVEEEQRRVEEEQRRVEEEQRRVEAQKKQLQAELQKAEQELQKTEQESQARGKAEAVLAVLAARGIVVSDAQRAGVLACRDLGMLDRWLVQAATAAPNSSVDFGPTSFG
jgi:flagellar biosynthesis GTPase FlhF